MVIEEIARAVRMSITSERSTHSRLAAHNQGPEAAQD